ncbi:hypothetical protein VTK26DRAFT_5060 [Humicola hyalothermophila]
MPSKRLFSVIVRTQPPARLRAGAAMIPAPVVRVEVDATSPLRYQAENASSTIYVAAVLCDPAAVPAAAVIDDYDDDDYDDDPVSVSVPVSVPVRASSGPGNAGSGSGKTAGGDGGIDGCDWHDGAGNRSSSGGHGADGNGTSTDDKRGRTRGAADSDNNNNNNNNDNNDTGNSGSHSCSRRSSGGKRKRKRKQEPDHIRFIEVLHGGVHVENEGKRRGARAWWEYTFSTVRLHLKGRFRFEMVVDRLVDGSRAVSVRTDEFEVF